MTDEVENRLGCMKLLLCPKCGDIFKLQKDLCHCDCGASAGKYREDSMHADVSGAALVIGIDNPSLGRAIKLHNDHRPEDHLAISAWIMAEPARYVTYYRDYKTGLASSQSGTASSQSGNG